MPSLSFVLSGRSTKTTEQMPTHSSISSRTDLEGGRRTSRARIKDEVVDFKVFIANVSRDSLRYRRTERNLYHNVAASWAVCFADQLRVRVENFAINLHLG